MSADAIPPELCCPVLKTLLNDPVVAADGETYERAFIENWFARGNDVSPKTKEKLDHVVLCPNQTVRGLVSRFSSVIPDSAKRQPTSSDIDRCILQLENEMKKDAPSEPQQPRSPTVAEVTEAFLHAVAYPQKGCESGQSPQILSPLELPSVTTKTGKKVSDGIFHRPKTSEIDNILERLRAVYNPDEDYFSGPFPLTIDQVWLLIKKSVEILRKERVVVSVPAPCKVFGDIHGQFADLIRHLDRWKATDDDFSKTSYMFLGDYVDRGYNSLEVICYLLALKIKYEHYDRFVLLRGNHETRSVNQREGGLLPECLDRLGAREGQRVWYGLNGVFEHLPLAGLISSKVLCIHGGISPLWQSVHDLETMVGKKPVNETTIAKNHVLYQLLWADPADSDDIPGIHKNTRGPGVISFGADIVRNFCVRNGLLYVIRGHECVRDGFELFAKARMWTVFSATNYCYDSMNAGGMLLINDRLIAMPHIIRPGAPKPPREYQDPVPATTAIARLPRAHSPIRDSRNMSDSGMRLHEDLQEDDPSLNPVDASQSSE